MDQPEQPKPDTDTPQPPPRKSLPLLRRVLRIITRTVVVFFAMIVLYFVIALIGLIPVNNDFEPTPDGVQIFVTSSAVHADMVVPIKTDTIDWRKKLPARYFAGDTSKATHVAFGWGDKGFYIGTPTWEDLRFSTAANALILPSASCMHVSLWSAQWIPEDARSVKISAAQYEKLVAYIDNSFRRNEDDTYMHIADVAYNDDDAFFEAKGNYHCFNTCNCWVGAAMRSAGIRTGWFTPLPKSMFLYLPRDDE